jgi:cytochrome c oxidase subunit 2
VAKALAALGGVIVCAPLTALADRPMSVLRSAGPKGDPVLQLNWGLLAISILVVVIIGTLLVLALSRQPQPRLAFDARGPLPVSRPAGGITWIYVGIGLTALTLLGSLVWSMVVLANVAVPSGKGGLELQVIGHQWWWQVNYIGDPISRRFTTANEIHIPVGVPVRITLKSADVIHSFWVPALSGKTDLIPGQTNTTWIEAREAGTYRGQCGEYCGAQHAHMAFSVVADPPATFDAWWQAQLADSPPPTDDSAKAGKIAFVRRCGSCHTVRGTDAGGIYGPDLTHLTQRATIAAGVLPNTPGHRGAWIADPQGIKPGSQMPVLSLSGPEIAAIQAYLATLK